jgi:hypothetical protein
MILKLIESSEHCSFLDLTFKKRLSDNFSDRYGNGLPMLMHVDVAGKRYKICYLWISLNNRMGIFLSSNMNIWKERSLYLVLTYSCISK